jgi:metal-dependent amidase/aminoacylase/carboxypeptidase family protein
MRVEYINPFVEAAFGVLKEVLNTDIKRGDLYLKNSSMSIMGVAALVGLAGGVEGRVLFDMTKETALNVASAMNMEEMKVLDELGIPYSTTAYTGGSTDVGNVSWRCPTMHLHFSFTYKNIALHTREYAELAGDRNRIERPIADGARAIARMGLIALTDGEARARMMADLEQARKE